MAVEDFSRGRKRKTLLVSLVVIIVVTLALGSMYFIFRNWVDTALSLFALTLAAVFSLVLTLRGRETAASVVIVVCAIAAIAYNIYTGEGLRDPAVLAFPALIVFGGLLLGRRAVFLIIGAVLANLGAQTFIQAAGLRTYRFAPSVTETVTVCLLISATALMSYFIIVYFESLIARIRGQSLALGRELEARRETEEALRESELRYRTIFHSVTDAIIIHDGESGAILDVNDRMTDMFGYGREAVSSMTMRDLCRVADSSPPGEDTAGRQPDAFSDGGREFECRARRRDGREFWAEVRTRPVRLLGAERRLTLVRDIDERKKSEERLLFAQKLEMLGMLTGGIVHDFNNALFALQGALKRERSGRETGVCRRDPGDGEFLDTVEATVGKLKKTTREFLSLARREELVMVAADLNLVLSRVADVCVRSFGPSVAFSCVPCEGPAPAVIDSDRIEQALLNLCLNARHAVVSMRADPGRRRGNISIRLERFMPDETFVERHADCRRAPYWRIAVEDDGVGMEPEILEKAFEPFFTTREKGEGNGLGLAIVKNIMRHHSGFVLAESVAGRGSAFFLYLPAADGHDEPEAESGERRENP